MGSIEEAQRPNGYLQGERCAVTSVVASLCRQMSSCIDAGVTHTLRHCTCEIEGWYGMAEKEKMAVMHCEDKCTRADKLARQERSRTVVTSFLPRLAGR